MKIHFFNNNLASVTQIQIIFSVNYNTHILQNLCVISFKMLLPFNEIQ